MTETGLVLRQREEDIKGMIQIMEANRDWMRDNAYNEVWLRFTPIYTFLKRYLERTTKKRVETEEREEKERKG